jgi:hypothetical protein
MNQLDERLQSAFASVGDTLSRRNLLRRAAVVAGAVAGYTTATPAARADHNEPCGNEHGFCGGYLCCGCYRGCTCRGETYHCGCRVSGVAYVLTAKWSKQCGCDRYDWWDCGYFNDFGGCANVGGCPGAFLGCSSSCPDPCYTAYVDCYRCTFRVVVHNVYC